jgi:hypothetical protein
MAPRRHQPPMRSVSELQELQVVSWRRGRLLAAGFGDELADELAGEFRIDLHALLELVERGCPPVLAARILAPVGVDVARS